MNTQRAFNTFQPVIPFHTARKRVRYLRQRVARLRSIFNSAFGPAMFGPHDTHPRISLRSGF